MGLRRRATGAPLAGGSSRLQMITWLGLDVSQVMSGLGWKFDFHDEPAFAPRPGSDCAAVRRGDGAGDGQTQAGPAGVVGPVGGEPPERLE